MEQYFKIKKRIRNIIIILIIVLIIAIIGIIINKKKQNLVHAKPLIGEYDAKNDKRLNLSGFGIFFDEYTGSQKASEIASVLDEITTSFIPDVYDIIKDYDENKLEQYYKGNVDNVRIMFGIDNLNSFLKFAKGLQSKKVDYNEWDRLDILKETFVDESEKSGYAYTEYEVTYTDDTVIRFSLYINKSATADIVYIVNIL